MNPVIKGEGFRRRFGQTWQQGAGSTACNVAGDTPVGQPSEKAANPLPCLRRGRLRPPLCHHHPGRGRGQALGGVAGPYLGAVFVKGDVPYPMDPVLDVPMLPENPQQSLCPSNSRCHTGYRITHRCLCPSFHRPLPLYPAYPRFHEGRLCLRWGHPSPTVPALPA